MSILRYAISRRADGSSTVGQPDQNSGRIVYDVSSIFYVNIEIATDSEATAQGPRDRPTRRHFGSQN